MYLVFRNVGYINYGNDNAKGVMVFSCVNIE